MATLDDAAKQKAEFFKRKREEQLGQVAALGQEEQDYLQRRFASLGAQGSGAQFAQAAKAREQQAARQRQVETDIMGQEIAAAEPDLARRFQAEQAQLGREYGTQERLGSEKFQAGQLGQQQQFAGEQARLGREYGTQERLGQQQFAGEQAGLARQFQTAERLAQQAYGSDEAGKARQFQAGQQLLQNQFASAEAALGRQFSAEERAAQNKFLAGESAASRDLQSRLAADDLALKKSIADMQNARDQQSYELAKKQFDVDLETTNFNKILALVMAGIPYSVASSQIKAATMTSPGGAAQPTVAAANDLFANPQSYSGPIPQASNWSANLGLGVY